MNAEALKSAVMKSVGGLQVPRHLVSMGAREDWCGLVVAELVQRDKKPDDVAGIAEKARNIQGGFEWPAVQAWVHALGGPVDAPNDEPPKYTGGAQYGIEADARRFGSKLMAGMPVGEPQLFGLIADTALRLGYITLPQLRKYQRASWLAHRRIYGDDAGDTWILDKCPAAAKDFNVSRETSDQRKPYAEG